MNATTETHEFIDQGDKFCAKCFYVRGNRRHKTIKPAIEEQEQMWQETRDAAYAIEECEFERRDSHSWWCTVHEVLKIAGLTEPVRCDAAADAPTTGVQAEDDEARTFHGTPLSDGLSSHAAATTGVHTATGQYDQLVAALRMAREELVFGGDWETARAKVDAALKSCGGKLESEEKQ